jgi:uncharacterized protein involved in response to NO
VTSPNQHSPSLAAFLSLGFRPLYVAGTAWAVVAMLLWVFVPQWLEGSLNGVVWHAHEMLWGFVATIAMGFLMTAGANWTGINPLHGAPLGGVALLWLVARIGLLAGAGPFYAVAAAADVLVFVLPALALGRAVVRARNSRNAAVPLLMLALGLTDALFLRAVALGDPDVALHWAGTGLLVMASVALLVARRVIPFFAMRALPGLVVPMHTRSGQWQLAAALVAAAAIATGFDHIAAAALTVAGLIALWQLAAWQPQAVRTHPILWILYLGFAGLALGLLAGALHLAGAVQRAAVHVHILAMGGFAVLIIGMVTRTALGHLGRALSLDRSMLLSYGLVIAAAVMRFAALAPTVASTWLMQVAGLLWAAGFTTYLWRFLPWLIRPRPDQTT